MSIYEYDQEEHIRLEREDAFEDGCKVGHAEGLAEGRNEGDRARLISQILKKLAKQKSVDVIAQELEEDTEIIAALIREMKEE